MIKSEFLRVLASYRWTAQWNLLCKIPFIFSQILVSVHAHHIGLWFLLCSWKTSHPTRTTHGQKLCIQSENWSKWICVLPDFVGLIDLFSVKRNFHVRDFGKLTAKCKLTFFQHIQKLHKLEPLVKTSRRKLQTHFDCALVKWAIKIFGNQCI